MKIIRSSLAMLVCVASFFISAATVPAYDIGPSTLLKRYTVLNNGDLQEESGFLQSNGSFKSTSSHIVDPIFYSSLSAFYPVSGKPIIEAWLFDIYKANGLLPNWVASEYSFSIGFVDYVIVAVKGKGDPNPIPTIITQPVSQRVLDGNLVMFTVDAEPWQYLSYQWYFKNKPLPGRTLDWMFVGSVSKADAGFYHVTVSAGGKPVLSDKAKLTIVDPVRIKTHPKPQTITAGKNVNLRVGATGTKPLAYQWYRDGQAITNATKTVLVIPRAQATNSGTYYVAVNNGVSWAWSSNAVVTIAAP